MEIYIADIRVLSEEEVFHKKQHLLTKERKEKIAGYHSAGDRQRGAAAGLLLEYGLRKKGYTLCEDVPGKKQVHLAQGEYGKPYLADVAGVYFNLSHTGDYAAAVFAESEVGIDIECIRTANIRLAQRFFSEEEYAYLESIQRECGQGERLNGEFTRLWTRKESYVKAVGEGMHLPLTDFNVLSDYVNGTAKFCIKTWKVPCGCVMSVCTKGAVQAEIETVDLRKII